MYGHMELSISKIENSYRNYGFEVKKDEKDILIFLYKKGRYFGVDIIPLNCNPDTVQRQTIVKDKYASLGYAVNIRTFVSVEETEKELFKSFFSYDATIARMKKKYDDFVHKQTKNLLGSTYQYIESPFELYDTGASSGLGLLSTVGSIIKKEEPQLIIIEAAAGYGKTCAVYEIMKELIFDSSNTLSPLFSELSKNRSAKIFRYILLDEIDQEFPSLNSELVLLEVKNGRIPLIIDGFDELLDKVNVSNVNVSAAFDEIETMLDTIGNLLEKNAKIILTTRKTAIFSGSEFDTWYQKWNNKFDVSRFSLKDPRIKDWLGNDRFDIVKERNIPIQYIANPVLLTFLRNIPIQDFQHQMDNPDVLIKQYFDRMLDRERERQNLIITTDRQYEIFKNVTRMLLDLDITVESKEFFKEIIKDQNSKLLEYTRSLYSGQNKPTLENLIDTLATHALLDRKGRDEAQIGFINDFVLGILIGEIICESTIEKIEKDYSYYMLDLACTAYKVQNRKNKLLLWEKVNKVKHKLQPISVFNYDIILSEGLARDYTDLSIGDYTFFNIRFVGYEIRDTVFLTCYFKNCFFDVSIFKGVSFVDCTFDTCTVNDGIYLDSSKEVSIIKCGLKECKIIEKFHYPPSDDYQMFTDLETDILRKLMSISMSKTSHIVQLFHSYDKSQVKSVASTLDDLASRDFIKIRGNHIVFNINKLHIVKGKIQ